MIVNSEIIKDRFVCSYPVSKYLEEHGVPLLGFEGKKFSFANTQLLKDVIRNSPFWVKALIAIK